MISALRHPSNLPLITSALLTAAALILGFMLWVGIDEKFVFAAPIILIPIILISLHNLQNSDDRAYQGLFYVATLGLITVFAIPIVRIIVSAPPVWDYHLFWIFGQASARGLNPYDQQNLLTIAAPLNLDHGVLVELYFFHSPPTLLFFAPLGWFNLESGFIVWGLIESALLAACIGLLWRMFWKKTGILGLLMVAAVVLMVRQTSVNYAFSQLNFQLLLFFLLYWFDRKHWRGGIWLALAIFTKPLAIFLLIYPIINHHWKTIIGMIGTMATLSLLTIMIYGPTMFFDYFLSNPISNDVPSYFYTESINKSMLATILRFTHQNPAIGSPMLNPIFIMFASVITVISAWLIYNLKNQENYDNWLFALIVALSLLLFPKTLSHYSFLLIAPMFVVMQYHNRIPGGMWGSISIVTVLVIILLAADFTFLAFALTWLGATGMGLWWAYNSKSHLKPQEHIYNIPSKIT